MGTHLPPISPEGFAGLALWLAEAKSGAENPDHSLLCFGLPHGRIREARIESVDGGAPCIAFRMQDQRDGTLRSPRIIDPAGFYTLRILLAPKSQTRIDRNVLDRDPDRPRKEMHFITVFGDITLLRILADARPGEIVKQTGDHHDLMRRSLTKTTEKAVRDEGKEARFTHQGRKLAKSIALANFETATTKGLLQRLPPHRASFEWMIDGGYDLLDQVKLSATSGVAQPTKPAKRY